jgi:predicted nicotinamide N-methyase
LAVPGAGASYAIAAPADPDAVLDEVAAAAGVAGAQGTPSTQHSSLNAVAVPEPHMPYWATPWAGGLALAEVVLARRDALRGRRVLELGCGLGTTAAAAMEAGARLAVADCFPETLAYCRYNALRNAGRVPATLLADWRTNRGAAALRRAGPFDLVLAADVLYEPEDVVPLLALVPDLVGPRGAFWLAEPGRATSLRFVEAAGAAGWAAERVVLERTCPGNAGRASVTVHVYALGAAPARPTAAGG